MEAAILQIQITLPLHYVAVVSAILMTPQMQVINAVRLPSSDYMVKKYHMNWLHCGSKIAACTTLVRFEPIENE